MVRLGLIIFFLLSACAPTAHVEPMPSSTPTRTPHPSPPSLLTTTLTPHPFICPEGSLATTDDLILKPFEIPTTDPNIFEWRIVKLTDTSDKPAACGLDCSLYDFREGETREGVPQFDVSISLVQWATDAEAQEFASTSWQEFSSNAARLEEFRVASWLPATTFAGLDWGNEIHRTFLSTSYGIYSVQIGHTRRVLHEFNVDAGSVQHLAELQIAKLDVCLKN